MEIIQIVSRLPPAIDGVGDYAFLLAQQLRQAHGIHTTFVMCDTAWGKVEIGKQKPEMELDGFKIHQLRERSARELLRVLAQPGMPQTVLLQYVGYGYEKRGCPVWLVNALRTWKMEVGKSEVGKEPANCQLPTARSHQLVTMFHELYAFGPPWRSSFWTSPVQRWLTKSLAGITDQCRTNTVRFASVLNRLAPKNHGHIEIFPVFSNVGELNQVVPLNQRKPQIAVFGSSVWRKKIYIQYKAELIRASHALHIEKIIDIGAATGLPMDFPWPVVEMGQQPAAIVGQMLAESQAGFLTYFDDSLAKSGIFAAYCAYGVLPILAGRGASPADEIRAGYEYLSAVDVGKHLTVEEMQDVASHSQAWYQKHSLSKTADSIAATVFRRADY